MHIYRILYPTIKNTHSSKGLIHGTFIKYHYVLGNEAIFHQVLKLLFWLKPQTTMQSSQSLKRKLWYIYTMEYYSAIKKNSFESVLMRWMKLEPIIQSEVSQKDKHQHSILTHIYGIQKDGNDNPICKTEKETQMYTTDFWTLWEKARVGCFERTASKHVYYLQ